MNKKQAKRLRKLASKHAKVAHSDSLTQETITETIKRFIKGEQKEIELSFTTRTWVNGSYKRIYKELKKAFKATPRPKRPSFLKNWEDMPCPR